MRLLTRQGHLVEEQGVTYLAEADADNSLTPLQAASCTYRIALGAAGGTEGAELAKHAEHRQAIGARPVRQRAWVPPGGWATGWPRARATPSEHCLFLFRDDQGLRGGQ